MERSYTVFTKSNRLLEHRVGQALFDRGPSGAAVGRAQAWTGRYLHQELPTAR